MDFKNLRRKVELYLHIQGTENKIMIEDFINESVLDFLRMHEWSKCKVMETITLDGSGVYDLSALLTNPFFEEIDLLDENGNVYTKVDYNYYLRTTEPRYLYSILGTDLYVPGDTGTLNFVFKTSGNPFTLVKNTDENLVTQYYHDIIKVMSAIEVYNFIGDIEQVQIEERKLLKKIIITKKTENRTRQRGKSHMVSRRGPGA